MSFRLRQDPTALFRPELESSAVQTTCFPQLSLTHVTSFSHGLSGHVSIITSTLKMNAVVTRTVLKQSHVSRQAIRSFSLSSQRDASWGFIGLGAMGKPCDTIVSIGADEDQDIPWQRTYEQGYRSQIH